jgi:hypothetical protein
MIFDQVAVVAITLDDGTGNVAARRRVLLELVSESGSVTSRLLNHENRVRGGGKQLLAAADVEV